MSKARPPIPEKTKVALLRETNYRCGYCMMNITPVAYFTENRNSHEAKNTIPTYYQPYDCAHIEPYNEEDTETNSLLNLIALCKSCHWKSEPQHNNAIIPKDELKALKLYWMIASGRFTRLEIDVLMECFKAQTGGNSNKKWVYIESMNTAESNMWSKPAKYNNLTVNLNQNGDFKMARIVVQQISGYLCDKIEQLGFIHYEKLPQGALVGTAADYGKYSITDLGIDFCKNFHEAYQELDKIEI